MLKKLWCFILTTLVVCNFPSDKYYAASAPANANSHYALMDEKGQAVLPDVSALCWVTESDVFFLGAGFKPSLFRWQLGQNQVELVQDNLLEAYKNWRLPSEEANDYPKNDAIVFSLSDGLYVLATETGEIKRYLTDTDEWEAVGSLLFGIEGITVLDADIIKDVARDGDNIFFLMASSELTELMQFDLSTGACSVLPETPFDSIESYTPDMLLVSLDGNIHVYDPHTQVLSDALLAADPISTAFAYNLTDDYLYFVRNGDIYQKKGEQPEELIRITELRNAPLSWDEDEQSVYGNAPIEFILPLTDGSIAYHTSRLPYEYSNGDLSEFLYVVQPKPLTGSIETLHVQNRYLSATAFFQLTHPNIRVEDCIINDDDSAHEGSHFPDVFVRSVNGFYLHPLYNRELMDLSKSQTITEVVHSYDKKITDAICEGDKIIGLPFSISINTIDYDKEKWNAKGLPDPPETVDELFALINLWDEQYADQYPNQPLLGVGGYADLRYGIWSAVTDAYIAAYDTGNAPVNFDTEEYRALIERIINMPDVKYHEWGVLLRFFMAFDKLHFPFISLDSKYGYNEYISIPPLKLTAIQPLRIESSLAYYCVAEDSLSPKPALEYLSFMAEFQQRYQPEVVFMMTGGVDHDYRLKSTPPFIHALPFIGMTDGGLSIFSHEAEGGFISNETLGFYQDVFSALDFDINSSSSIYAPDYEEHAYPWPTYVANEACTIDEFIEIMNDNSMRIFSKYSE